MKKYLILFLSFLVLLACQNKSEKPVFIALDAKSTGLQFTNALHESDGLNILDYLYFYNGGGVAVGDINNDNLPDVYLVSNQNTNQLFLNKGNWHFENITEKARVGGKSDWNTGAVMADVNGDGLLDIYVLAVVGTNGFNGHNELFINQGDGKFKEQSAAYGLDFDNFSSSAAFFDFDLDGDLDLYLLNHAVHTADSFGPAEIRLEYSYESGDKLLRNDNGTFTDVSEVAGIYGGPNGYGLGVAISDLNADGYPDLYVSNDFHEDDYLYFNNGDGTFTEKGKEMLGHTSRFSMGSDIADVNSDGLPDIISLDMLSDDETVLKSSVGDDDFALHKFRTDKLNYHHQYARNMLQINKGTYFEETALMSGIAATDWSWSALLADFDNDTQTDLFVSNGIPIRPNNLDFIKYVSDEQIKKKLETTRLVDDEAIKLMPSGTTRNFVFKGNGHGGFENKSEVWLPKDKTNSNGTAYADFDLDGDLDLIINNLNSPAQLLQNQTEDKNYLNLKLSQPGANTLATGSKALLYAGSAKLVRELFPTRGFQSSSEALLHFGLDTLSRVDSLVVIWPDRSSQKIVNPTLNQSLKVEKNSRDSVYYAYIKTTSSKTLFKDVTFDKGLNFSHIENEFNDFNRQKLIPYRLSDRGPAVAVGDANGDGKDDVFFGSSKFERAQLFIQQNGYFKSLFPFNKEEEVVEETDALWIDANSDGKNDLFTVSGGDEFYGKTRPLLDRLFINQNDSLIKLDELPAYYANGSVVRQMKAANGNNYLFVGSASVPYDFGQKPDSYLLSNENGKWTLTEQPALKALGMVTDAIWWDFDNDRQEDLIVVGEWMVPTFLKNENGKLKNVTSNYVENRLSGLWQMVIPFDLNKDGESELILGNWGLNTKFTASMKFPLRMYVGDLDQNGSNESVISVSKNGKYYPLMGLDDLASQMEIMRKVFTSYQSFAGKTTEETFEQRLNNAALIEVNELRSGYLQKQNGKYVFVPFEKDLQVAPIRTGLVYDFMQTGNKQLMLGGNYMGVIPFHGRLDSFAGVLIDAQGNPIPLPNLGLNFAFKQLQSLDIIHIDQQPYLLCTFNNDKAQLYQIQ